MTDLSTDPRLCEPARLAVIFDVWTDGRTAVAPIVELRRHIEAQAIEIDRLRKENDRLMQANRILQQRDDYVAGCLV